MKKVLVLVLLLCLLVLGCTNQNNLPKDNPTIKDIVDNPKLYENKTVMLSGYYGERGPGNGKCDFSAIIMDTKSDELFYDDTGCLYMSLKGSVKMVGIEFKLREDFENLETYRKEQIGKPANVTAIIRLIDSKPILS